MACDIDSLEIDACANGFWQAAYNEPLYRALVLQMLCNGIVPQEPQGGILGEGDQPILGEDGGGILFL